MALFREWIDNKYKDEPNREWTSEDLSEYIEEKKLSAVVLMVDGKKSRGPIDIVTLGFEDPVCPEVAEILARSACVLDSITHGAPPGAIIN